MYENLITYIIAANKNNHHKLVIKETKTNKGDLQLSRNAKVPNPLMCYNGCGPNLINENTFVKW